MDSDFTFVEKSKWSVRKPIALLIVSFMLAGSVAAIGATAVTDSSITLAVERQLTHDQEASFHRVDVLTTNGIVTLDGSVDNLMARDRAAEVTMTVKGVRAVINQIEVAPAERTDAQIGLDVGKALADDPATKSYEIQATVRNGQVILTGRVDAWHEKQLAAQVAKGIKGVEKVVNEIEIDVSARRTDNEIADEIRRRLMWDVWVDDGLIDLNVNDGAVTLKGVVGSLAEKTRAFDDAWVTGVVSVDDSNLKIDWTRRDEMRRSMEYNRLGDTEVRKALEAAFSYDPRLAPFKIDLLVENGVVTLSGVVDNLKARKAAEEDARNTLGVWWVKNHLKVRPAVGPVRRPIQDADREIAQKVRMALLRDPVIEQHEIAVTVNNYAVKLEGRVDSRFEKVLAVDVASRVHGVVTVFSDLTVNRDWAVKPDWQIEMQIKEELFWSPFVEEDRVAVTVRDGVATLTGAVQDLRERRVATENAYEGGARRVRNQLKVLYGPQQLRPRP